jgi:hypothetical protein
MKRGRLREPHAIGWIVLFIAVTLAGAMMYQTPRPRIHTKPAKSAARGTLPAQFLKRVSVDVNLRPGETVEIKVPLQPLLTLLLDTIRYSILILPQLCPITGQVA